MALILKEGILANNDILSKTEFEEFINPILDERLLHNLNLRLNSILKFIKREQIKEAYKEWESLQRNILQNKDYATSLLFIENIDSENKDYQFKYATKEYDILSNRGKLTRISNLMKVAYQESIQEQINEHLSEFITDISTKTISDIELIRDIFKSKYHDIKHNASEARWDTHDWSYKNIVYGKNPVWQGNATDAFMNHMAHLHVQVLAGNMPTEQQNLFAQSVWNEEKDNIFKLLADSLNHTSWITGGDIIIKYQGQLFNIQLKTGQILKNSSKRRRRIGGKLKITELTNLIITLKNDIILKDTPALIDHLYAELKTSGWVEETNKDTADIITNLVTTNLHSVKNLTIN